MASLSSTQREATAARSCAAAAAPRRVAVYHRRAIFASPVRGRLDAAPPRRANAASSRGRAAVWRRDVAELPRTIGEIAVVTRRAGRRVSPRRRRRGTLVAANQSTDRRVAPPPWTIERSPRRVAATSTRDPVRGSGSEPSPARGAQLRAATAHRSDCRVAATRRRVRRVRPPATPHQTHKYTG